MYDITRILGYWEYSRVLANDVSTPGTRWPLCIFPVDPSVLDGTLHLSVYVMLGSRAGVRSPVATAGGLCLFSRLVVCTLGCLARCCALSASWGSTSRTTKTSVNLLCNDGVACFQQRLNGTGISTCIHESVCTYFMICTVVCVCVRVWCVMFIRQTLGLPPV